MLELDLSTFPAITTHRLHLRELTHADAPALFTLRADERVMRHIPRPPARAIEDALGTIDLIARDRAAGQGITWAIAPRTGGDMIGTIGYYRLKPDHHRAEVGYLLAPAEWGKGFMSEALAAVVREGFQRFGFHSIEAITDPRNTASNRVLEREGFVREALLREDHLWNNAFQDSAVYAILADQA